MKILIAANSPGEIAWIRALSAELEQRGWSCDVLLYPCTFATGREADVLRTFPAVETVWDKHSFPHLWWRAGARYPAGTPLLHLGGDLMYTGLLSWRWKWRSWSYLWARRWWDRVYAGYFSRNAQTTAGILRRGIAPSKIEEVGELIVDATRLQVPELPEKDPHLITFLPGSRPEEIRHLLPFCARVAELLLADHPELRFQATLSPFLDLDTVRRELERPPDPRMAVTDAHLEQDRYVCRSGLEVPILRENSLPKLARSALALSLPGTKTAEAAVLGVPSITLLPLNCPEELPVGGLVGLLDLLPGGSHLKGRLLQSRKHRVGIVGLPNQLLGEKLMPELVDVLTPEFVAEQVRFELQQPERLHAKGLRLRQAYAKLGGCAARMLDALTNYTGCQARLYS